MRRILLCFMVLSIVVLTVFCSGLSASSTDDSGSDSMNSILIQPTVKLNETITKKLPLQLWEWDGEIKRYTVSTEHQSVVVQRRKCIV